MAYSQQQFQSQKELADNKYSHQFENGFDREVDHAESAKRGRTVYQKLLGPQFDQKQRLISRKAVGSQDDYDAFVEIKEARKKRIQDIMKIRI